MCHRETTNINNQHSTYAFDIIGHKAHLNDIYYFFELYVHPRRKLFSSLVLEHQQNQLQTTQGHFRQELEGPWPWKYTISPWWNMPRLCPTSLYTRAWGPKGPRKFEWIKNLHGVLHGIQWIMFHVLQDLHQAHLKEVDLTQTERPWHSKISKPSIYYSFCVTRPTSIGQ